MQSVRAPPENRTPMRPTGAVRSVVDGSPVSDRGTELGFNARFADGGLVVRVDLVDVEHATIGLSQQAGLEAVLKRALKRQ